MIRSTAFKGGLKSSFPIVAGFLPVGFAFGVAAEGAQAGTLAAVFTSLFIYVGASQFALVGLLKDGVPILSAALITLGLNLRHLLYGPGLSRDTEEFSLRERLVAAFGLTDEVFAVAFSRIGIMPHESRFWWLMGLEFGAYFMLDWRYFSRKHQRRFVAQSFFFFKTSSFICTARPFFKFSASHAQ